MITKSLFGCLIPTGISLCLFMAYAGAEPVAEAKRIAEAGTAAEYKNEVKVEVLLQTSKTVDGKPIVYPENTPELRVILVEIPPGAETGWHTHPTPSAAYILAGEISVEIKGQGTKTYRAGDSFAETINTLHNGTNRGEVPVRILMTVVGEKGAPTAVRP